MAPSWPFDYNPLSLGSFGFNRKNELYQLPELDVGMPEDKRRSRLGDALVATTPVLRSVFVAAIF